MRVTAIGGFPRPEVLHDDVGYWERLGSPPERELVPRDGPPAGDPGQHPQPGDEGDGVHVQLVPGRHDDGVGRADRPVPLGRPVHRQQLARCHSLRDAVDAELGRAGPVLAPDTGLVGHGEHERVDAGDGPAHPYLLVDVPLVVGGDVVTRWIVPEPWIRIQGPELDRQSSQGGQEECDGDDSLHPRLEHVGDSSDACA